MPGNSELVAELMLVKLGVIRTKKILTKFRKLLPPIVCKITRSQLDTYSYRKFTLSANNRLAKNYVMLKFHLQTQIQKPVEEVVRLYKSRQLMPQWQPGLLTDESAADKRGNPIHRLTYRIGNRNMIMTERILKSTSRGHDVVYEMKGVWNAVHSSFTPQPDGSTLWTSDISFRFKWIMKLIAPFMRKGFQKQSEIIMKNFKNFAERQLR